MFYLTVTLLLTLLITVILSTLNIYNKNKSINKINNNSQSHKLSMFSLQQSYKSLVDHHPYSPLNVLNGIRSISMIWVVLGHVMSLTISGSLNIASSI